MRPPYNKLALGRTSFVEGVYPPSAGSGQVHSMKEGKLTRFFVSQELEIAKGDSRTPLVSLGASSQRFSSAQGIRNRKGG